MYRYSIDTNADDIKTVEIGSKREKKRRNDERMCEIHSCKQWGI